MLTCHPHRGRARRRDGDRSDGNRTQRPEPRRPGGGTRQVPRRQSDTPPEAEAEPVIPGEILYPDGNVIISEGLEVTTLRATNTSDRPIRIGSHFHFAEVNVTLEFERDADWGKRLAVPSGGAERIEPGAVLEANLVPIQGKRIVLGLLGLCKGEFDNAKG